MRRWPSDPVVDSQLPEYRILLDSLGDDFRNKLVHSAILARHWIHARASVYEAFAQFLRENGLGEASSGTFLRIQRCAWFNSSCISLRSFSHHFTFSL